jgi:Predicted membrane protein
VRLLEPVTDFTGTPSARRVSAAIQAAEKAAADQANAKRRELQDQVHRDHIIHVGLGVASIVVSGLAIGLAVPIFRRYGAELPKPADIPEYWRDPPNDPPAVSQAVMRFGSIKDDAFTCTLVDLAQRGYLTITEPKRKEFAFERTAKPLDGLLPFESDAGASCSVRSTRRPRRSSWPS